MRWVDGLCCERAYSKFTVRRAVHIIRDRLDYVTTDLDSLVDRGFLMRD